MRTTPKLAQKLGFGASSPKKQFSVNFAGREERRRSESAQERSDLAARFLRGYWIFVGPGFGEYLETRQTAERTLEPRSFHGFSTNMKKLVSQSQHPQAGHPNTNSGKKTASISTRARSVSARFCHLIESVNIQCTFFAIKKCLDDLQQGNRTKANREKQLPPSTERATGGRKH